MNPEATLDLGSRRAREARAYVRLHSLRDYVLGAFLLLSLGGGLTYMAGNPMGLTFIGASAWLLMVYLWLVWGLTGLKAGQPGTLAGQLAPEVLGRIHHWPLGASELFGLLLKDHDALFIFIRYGIAPNWLTENAPSSAEAVIKRAQQLAGQDVIDGAALGIATVLESNNAPSYLASLEIEEADLIKGITWVAHKKKLLEQLRKKHFWGGLARDWTSGYTPILSQLAENVSGAIEAGRIVTATLSIRAQILHDAISIMQRSGVGLLLVGKEGSGKTTIVNMLAQQLLEGAAPPALSRKKIYSIRAAYLISFAQSSGASLESVLLKIAQEVKAAGDIILLLDDAHLFFTQGVGAVNLAGALLPLLKEHALPIIITFDQDQLRPVLEANPSLTEALYQLTIPELDRESTLHVMQENALVVEARQGHSVFFTYQALKEAYEQAAAHVVSSVFPGKGVHILAQAVNFADGASINAESIRRCVESTLGIKITSASVAEKQQLLNLEELLHRQMINQNRAVAAVANALRRTRAGVRNPGRPVGSFLFLGPTGVGKTELSRALADVYFGGRERVVRIDMSEYPQPSDVARFLDPAHLAQSSSLLSKIRENPFSVVVLDEIEKAHPDILNLLLQMLDEGRLTDTNGNPASFKDSIIIATSNAGADEIRRRIEEGEPLESFEKSFVNQLIESHAFRPELLNRFDDIVLFRPLTPDELRLVVGHIMDEVNQELDKQKITVSLTEDAVDWLVSTGFDPRLGARPMRRMVQRSVENLLAKAILGQTIAPGSRVTLDRTMLESQAAEE